MLRKIKRVLKPKGKPTIVKPFMKSVVTHNGIVARWCCPNGYHKSKDGTYCVYTKDTKTE